MTGQKLFELLQFIDNLNTRLNLQSKLESVRNALNQVANQPAVSQHQSSLASALSDFESAAAQLQGLISPSQYAALRAMGGEEFFDPSIADKVKESVQMNAMTPSVARDTVQQLAERRADFLNTVRNARDSLQKLKITTSALQPGSADLAFLIPRELFDNELGQFAKELNFIHRLLQKFSEALTGTAEQVQLEQLSSSLPTIALTASVPVIGALVLAVNKFLEAWERIERIRKVRAELAEIGMKGKALEELTEQITTIVEEVVEETTETVLVNYPGGRERRNELNNGIRRDALRLFGQIERGLTIEFRAEPRSDAEATEQKALQDIFNASRTMRFPEITQEPMLLGSGEILEGEIKTTKQVKKTTTQKTTTEKKGAQKGDLTTQPKE